MLVSLLLFLAGWVPLFDEKSLSGWMWSTETHPAKPAWGVEDGTLCTTPGDGTPVYLLTRDSFGDFDLEFEWKMERGGNSGIKYRFQGYWAGEQLRDAPTGPGRIEPVALEYQIIDDEAHPDALSDRKHTTAAIYEYWPATLKGPAKPDVWHKGRIVAQGLHIQHWLDGEKVVDIRLDDPRIQQSFAQSRRKQSSPVLARHERRESPVALQYHDGKVWFRHLRIRRLD